MNTIKLLEVYLQGTFLEVRLLGQKVNVAMVLLDIAKFLFIFCSYWQYIRAYFSSFTSRVYCQDFEFLPTWWVRNAVSIWFNMHLSYYVMLYISSYLRISFTSFLLLIFYSCLLSIFIEDFCSFPLNFKTLFIY